MSYRIRYSAGARADLARLFSFLAERDLATAKRARKAIDKAARILYDFPFSCRKASPDTPRLRELVVPCGSAGFVLLFEIADASTINILAARHQREGDFY